jgi:hypothetical protein
MDATSAKRKAPSTIESSIKGQDCGEKFIPFIVSTGRI